MTDYTDLIARLRDTDTGFYNEFAADALEAQARRIADLRKEADMMHGEYKTAAARIAELEAALKQVLLDIDFMVEAETIPDIRSDVIYCAARAALEKKND